MVTRPGAAWRRLARRPLAVLCAVLLLLGGAWLVLDRAGVRAGLEDAARDYLALRKAERFRSEILFAAEESHVDPYLLAALMWVESSGRPDVRSKAGAVGLFQLRPITWEWRAEELGVPVPTEEELVADPLLQARIAADDLAWLLRTYDGDVERALVAYNTGTGRLKQLSDAAGGWEAFRAEGHARRDSPLFRYVERVLRYREAFRARGIYADAAGAPPAGAAGEGTSAAGSPAGGGVADELPAQPGDAAPRKERAADGGR